MEWNPSSSSSRSAFARWGSPDANSSWMALWVNTAIWAILIVAWVLYLVFADVETYRMILYPVLSLVAVAQIVSNGAAIRKKRSRER